MTEVQDRSLARVEAPFRLDGEVALITGGGSGLGYGIARCMVSSGARVVLVGRREAVLRQAVTELGPAASFIAADITAMANNPAVIEEAARRAGGNISILVNNAGVHLKKPALDTTEAEFLAVLQTHVTASFSLTRAAAAGMLARNHGVILFTASMTSFIGMPNVAAYSAAKSAFPGLVRSLSAEFAPHGVRVNAIAPGWIASEMLESALAGDPDRKQRILRRTPMERFGRPADVGWAAAYLSSPAASFITGVVLPVDGGASIGF